MGPILVWEAETGVETKTARREAGRGDPHDGPPRIPETHGELRPPGGTGT